METMTVVYCGKKGRGQGESITFLIIRITTSGTKKPAFCHYVSITEYWYKLAPSISLGRQEIPYWGGFFIKNKFPIMDYI